MPIFGLNTVKNISQNYDIPLDIYHVDIQSNKNHNIEALARYARYEEIEKHLEKNDVFLTAHHQDDQAETLLLQLFRGAGIKGLAAMPFQKKLGLGIHLRPLLQFSRNALEQYALEHELIWIDDESNSN